MSSLRIGGLVFLGPRREPASIEFRPGLNVICGASETGKSFIVEAIDFMLGSQKPLRDIPERAGFDRIRMPVTSADWPPLGLERSTEGGHYAVYEEELLEAAPRAARRTLREQHSAAREDTLSHALLERIGLTERRVRKNLGGETYSLSFRYLSRLCLVNEDEIQRAGSPLVSVQFTQQTVQYAVFKLLVTGNDDSALVSAKDVGARRQSVAGKVEMLDELIEELEAEIDEQRLDKAELEEQRERLDGEMKRQNEALGEVQARLDEIMAARGETAQEIRRRQGRLAEIEELTARFELLDRHYRTDLKRLEAIHESGSIFVHLERDACPLCGAEHEYHDLDGDCDGNTEAVVQAADAEIEKIRHLGRELGETVGTLRSEAESIGAELPALRQRYDELDERLSEVAAPALSSQRESYKELVSKRVEVTGALDRFTRLEKLLRQREELEKGGDEDEKGSEPGTEIASATLDAFAGSVRRVLSDWHYPGAERVHFDENTRDFQIDGKRRGSAGKGLRAITHAAVNVALLEFCLERESPHPGFVVLDSPLLAYWGPEGDEDDLSGTDVKERFYEYLLGLKADAQVIVIENEHPPAFVQEQANVVVFTKNPHLGRYGFFEDQEGQ